MSDAALGPHLADQWALSLALAVWKRQREAAFTCTELTAHAKTNFEVVSRINSDKGRSSPVARGRLGH